MTIKREDLIKYGVYDSIFRFDGVDKKGQKVRPVVLLDTFDGRMGRYSALVMMITSTYDGKVKRHKKPFDIDIRYWKEAGLDHESRIRCDNMMRYPGEYLIRFRGKLEKEDYDKITNMIRLVEKSSFDTPWNFINWMKREGVVDTIPTDGVNNNNNLIQSLDEIKESKQANCIDATIATHNICINNGYLDKIVWVKWHINATSTPGHLFLMFTKDQKRFYSVQWLGHVGEILGPYDNWNECKNKSIDYLTISSSRFRYKRYTSYVFTEEDIKYINDLEDPITQRELLDHIETNAVFEQVEKIDVVGFDLLQASCSLKYM